MSLATKHHPYALRIPTQEAGALAKAQEVSGQSINQLILQCIRKALPDVLAAFSVSSRVTNLPPLPAAELRRIYAAKDELRGVTARQIAAFQSQREPQ